MKYIITSSISGIIAYLIVALFNGNINGYFWQQFVIFLFFVFWLLLGIISSFLIDIKD